MTSALLLLVHGSPRLSANDPVFAVLDRLRARAAYPIVEVGFLECNEPDIPTAIARCVSLGAEEIIAVPYFLHTGNHVANDIPALLEAASARYPGVRFRLARFLGQSARIAQILARRAESA